MDRRRFLLSSAALIPAAIGASAMSATPSAAQSMQKLCDETYDAFLKLSPMLCTTYGVDDGPYAALRSQLEGDTPADRAAYASLLTRALASLATIERRRLAGMDRINYDTLQWQWSMLLNGVKDFAYGVKAPSQPQSPYVISHLSGMAQALPGFFDTNHLIATRDDAEAYLARLERVGAILDSETGHFEEDVAAGARPPAFLLQRALGMLTEWREQPAEANLLVSSLVRRTRDRGLAGDWSGRSTAIFVARVRPAIEKQIAALQAQLPRASSDAGVWRLPDGKAYYAHMIHCGTSTRRSPAEIHRLGRQLVAELGAEADRLLRAQGLSQGTVGERMAALYTDARFIQPDTDAGREAVLNIARGLIDKVTARLPSYFATAHRAQLLVRRPPPLTESAGGPYYLAGTVSGSRPGSYYLPLAHTASTPSWTLPSITFHEAMPGHHMQNSLLIENAAIPAVRKLNLAKVISDFNAYDEGWGLYSEQLADEMGLYTDDAFGRIGYVDEALLRAARLVVDTGLHDLRWTRTQAVDYMTSVTGKHDEAENEIDRYCVWPGQALGYMVGKMEWLRLRKAMQTRQGKAFDIRRFHSVGLDAGSTGFEVLERVYREQGLI